MTYIGNVLGKSQQDGFVQSEPFIAQKVQQRPFLHELHNHNQLVDLVDEVDQFDNVSVVQLFHDRNLPLEVRHCLFHVRRAVDRLEGHLLRVLTIIDAPAVDLTVVTLTQLSLEYHLGPVGQLDKVRTIVHELFGLDLTPTAVRTDTVLTRTTIRDERLGAALTRSVTTGVCIATITHVRRIRNVRSRIKEG